jgi:hypothetical protein
LLADDELDEREEDEDFGDDEEDDGDDEEDDGDDEDDEDDPEAYEDEDDDDPEADEDDDEDVDGPEDYEPPEDEDDDNPGVDLDRDDESDDDAGRDDEGEPAHTASVTSLLSARHAPPVRTRAQARAKGINPVERPPEPPARESGSGACDNGKTKATGKAGRR